jgi:predicted metal-dependent phosphoesterase TrpH
MKKLQLTIDLVPKGAWGSNLRTCIPVKDWDKLRCACYERAGNRCSCCGCKCDKLDAHEVWEYDIKTKTQTLVDIVALCSCCHLVKHYHHAESEGKDGIARRHFCKVNRCDNSCFEEHYFETMSSYNERSKVDKWELKAPTLERLGGQGVVFEPKQKIEIINPYVTVNWKNVYHIKAALHTHTVNSLKVDHGAGDTKPEDLVRAYDKAGFGAIVLTDHDYVSYVHNNPLLNVAGNELSKNEEHILSYGTAYEDKVGKTFDRNIADIKDAGGIVYFAHPTRNKKPSEWWMERIMRYDVVKGIEVFNTRNFGLDSSEKLWDSILSQIMPNKIVYGIATDDNHSSVDISPSSSLGTGYTTVLLDGKARTNQGLLEVLKNGVTYISSKILSNGDEHSDCSKTYPDVLPPKIQSIVVTDNNIKVTADRACKIEWITDGQVIHSVENCLKSFKTKFDVSDVKGSYVRFKLIGKGGQTLSQPFGLVR